MENEQDHDNAKQPLGTPRKGDARHIRVPSTSDKSTGNAPGKQPPIACTRFEAYDGQELTKRFTLDPTGKIRKISQTQLGRGIAHRVEIPSIDALPAFLDSLTYNQCISTGVYDIPECEIVLDREITDEMVANGIRSRTKRFLTSSQHALALLDHDPGEYTPEAHRCAKPMALMGLLEQCVPELRGVAYVGAGSSSAGVYNEATGERYPSTGIHLYISTVGIDPVALARIIKVRAWNSGYGYIALSSNGSMLPRCPVDLAVFAPERLIYEAIPLLDLGVGRDQRVWASREGTALFHIADPTADEIDECERRIAEAMRDPELVQKSAELRQAHYNGSVKRLAELAGITIEQARERLPKPPVDSDNDVRYLANDYVLEIKGAHLTVSDLIARGREFDQCAMPDPIEGSTYGTSTAKFYFDELNGGVIHSFAHGRKTTYILLDFAPCEYTVIEAPTPRQIRLDEPLPKEFFPHRHGEEGPPKATIPNVRMLLSGYGIVARYDVICKRLILTVPGHSGTDDNFDSSALAHVLSLANLNGIPTGNLPHFIAAIADENPVNPVADWILSKPWDGIDRLPLLYATLTTREDFPVDLKETLLLRWLLSAVAAVFMHTGFKARGVLVLQGPQSIGKTTWFIALIDDPLLRDKVLLIDHHLDASNKDSKLVALSHWLVEIGELDSSFKRDVSRLKGFVTNLRDKIRRPYGLREAEYQRRTVFCASVNHGDYLVDETGNSRWWSLPVTAVNYQHGIPMQQLWAQVATIYQAGEQWWLTREEEHLLEQQNQKHRSVSAIRDAIDSKLKWDAPKSEWKLRTATKVLEMVGYKQPNNPQTRECGAVLRERLGEPTQSQGKTRWMVPPAHLWGYEE